MLLGPARDGAALKAIAPSGAPGNLADTPGAGPAEAARLARILDVFHALFARSEGVRLRGGFPEPLYLAPREGRPAEIRFTRDYPSSCLHEVAHWCLAGGRRRALDDYGYWYRPDGRGPAEQAEFYRVEAAPQALEWAFSLACGQAFRVSLDNLGGAPDGEGEFSAAVREKLAGYVRRGLPPRARAFLDGLRAGFGAGAPGAAEAWLAARLSGALG